MPKWVRNVLWAFALIILIARWRDLARWLRSLLVGITAPFSELPAGFEDPTDRFLALGLVIVMVVALWKIYWMHRSDRKP